MADGRVGRQEFLRIKFQGYSTAHKLSGLFNRAKFDVDGFPAGQNAVSL